MRVALVISLVLALTGPVAAQPEAEEDARGRIDVSRLPLDLERIQRELQASKEEQGGDGLNLRYQVEVFGRAPELELFTPEDNLAHGPVPYGAPTHSQIIEHITPREYRPPVMDLSALMRWLADKAK